MRNYRLTYIVIVLTALFTVSLHGQSAREFYLQGLELKANGDDDNAVKAFEKAIGRDRGFSEAYYEMALLFKSRDNAPSLKRATDLLLDAMRTATDSAKYKAKGAEVYMLRGMYEDAKTMYNRALKIDPDYIPALEGIAKWYGIQVRDTKDRVNYDDRELLQYIETIFIQDEMININYPMLWDSNMVKYARDRLGATLRWKDVKLVQDQIHELSYEEFVALDDSTADAYNRRVLELRPFDRDALYRQGLLHFENRRFPEFTGMFEELVSRNQDDKDYQLFLGLGYQRLREYEKASEVFEIALSLMSDEECAVFSNVGYLKTGGLKETEIRNTEQDTAGFWYRRDPLYLTGYNEREMEHYSRVAEANLRYSIPRRSIEGWKTYQGKMLIKYGPPIKRKVFHDAHAGFFVPSSGLRNLKYDFWYYKDFTFAFETGVFDLENKYEPSIFNKFEFPAIIRDVEKVYPEYYEYEPKGEKIDIIFDYANFRGKDGKTRVELYYSIPLRKLEHERDLNLLINKYKTGVFLFDKDWNKTFSDIRDKEMKVNAALMDTSTENRGIDQFDYELDSGTYNFSFEIMDQLSDNVGLLRDTLILEQFGYDSLQMSDIQLASAMAPFNPSQIMNKDNLLIIPNPSRRFQLERSIYIYFEIYNLLLDSEAGTSLFEVEYTIRFYDPKNPPDAKIERSAVERLLRKLVVNAVDKGITNTYTYRGSSTEEPQFLQIDLNVRKRGIYQLITKITDRRSGQSVEKSLFLRITRAAN